MKEIIKRLTEAYGPSGHEEEIRNLIRSELEDEVDEIRVDKLGNLITYKEGSSDKKVMLAAHMDEIGLIVTHIDEDGFIRFSNVGGVSPYILLGERVIFGNGLEGVISKEELDSIKKLRFSKMYIDVGLDSKEDVKEEINIGDVATYKREFSDLGDRLLAKSLDNRAGCALLIETIKNLSTLANDTYFVFTVQEEVGIRGAQTSAFGINPDLGIAVDVTGTGDTPESRRMAVSLGEGPAIKVKDRSVITHPKVKDLMVSTAEEQEISYQLEVLEFGGTDAGSIHLTRKGVPTGVLSIPARYIHTPSEVVDYSDVENGVKLLDSILQKEV
ncbi:M42 family metallopeptidase [Acetohalobium arabaticum]|uniref:Cellulase n=1 Tax=Acetohalobium arabaticum (strain ATCC 49924 / DSM 5501 / Z-7288) TaxID=574087 RepID=D9QQL5_ACEAZ|nr:M42 family metallopeptidase [Acetohalobium arabaticum]ADL12806.1 Cellulase [Acetohalobium arabaticum DSM 5501]